MPLFRVFYLREDLSRRFQETPSGSARRQLKPKEYTLVTEIDAANEYAAWKALQAAETLPRRFSAGDVLEEQEGKPRLCVFGGFEEATWYVPEARQPPDFPVDQPPITPPPQRNPPREPTSAPPGEEPSAPRPAEDVETPPSNVPPD